MNLGYSIFKYGIRINCSLIMFISEIKLEITNAQILLYN